mgnify:CR=1 FL=1
MQIEIPTEIYDAVRELYPKSRPPFRARPFDVQLIGGMVLGEGRISEMKTGEGKTIVAPLDASRVFPPMVISMVDVGEKTGDMPQMLEKIADTYDEEVDRAVESLTSLIEPIMIVFLAVIVGGIVIAMFLPLIVMIESLGGAE